MYISIAYTYYTIGMGLFIYVFIALYSSPHVH